MYSVKHYIFTFHWS